MNSVFMFFIKSLVAAGLQTPADVIAQKTDTQTQEPKGVKSWKLQRERGFTLAAHRSHSSHRSHGSHRSSAGGSRSTPRKSPSYTPPSVEKPDSGVRKSSPVEKNNESTPPSSILPASPATSHKVFKLMGNQKAFKVLTMRVQTALFALGFYNSTIDGEAGTETSAAISKYQLKNNLPVTGRLSDSLLDALNIDADAIELKLDE